MNDDTQLLVQAIVENAKLLGLKWILRPGYISSLSFVQATAAVVLDGDETPMTAINILGPINLDARVMCLIVPHEAVYIIGKLGNYGLGYEYSQTVYFTVTGTFTKADYVGLRAVNVKCVSGGGGSGGAATTAAGQGATSGGGAGGTYAEAFLLAAELGDSETITVGAGGTGGAAGANAGGDGGDSSFGTLCIASGGTTTGSGGAAATATTTGSAGGQCTPATSVGDLIVAGQEGSDGRHLSTGERINDAMGGASGHGYGYGRSESNVTASAAGLAGQNYGGGASGAHNQASQTQVAGAAGGDGIVIVDIYV
jgi:hypothetical protein